MEPPQYEGTPCPYGQAGWFSRLGFRWVQPLVEQGWKRPINNNDMYSPIEVDSPTHCATVLNREWKKELSKKQHGATPYLWWAICRAVAPTYLPVGILCLLQKISQIAQPVLLSYLLTYFSEDSGGIQEQGGWLYALAIALCVLIDALSGPCISYQFRRAALQARSALAGLLYRKLLVMSRGALHSYSRGQVIEYIVNDVCRMSGMTWFGHEVWLGPLSSVITLYIIYKYLGLAALLGILTAVLTVPIAGFLGKKTAQFRLRRRERTERRKGVMTEVLSSMRVIKLLYWEEPLLDIINTVRRKELQYLWHKTWWSSLTSQFTQFSCRLVQVVTISVYVFSGNVMTAATIFPALMVFNSLQTNLLSNTSSGYSTWLQCQASLERIQSILEAEELPGKPVRDNSHLPDLVTEDTPPVFLQNVSTKWESIQDKFVLKNARAAFKEGELILVTGPVGSGKTALLLSLMGEIPVVQGQLVTRGRLSYAGQQPWVFASTIRQNILGGLPLKRHRYKQVLDVTALTEDVTHMPYGDLTRVGESGVTLSGGQKARLNLARALYREADIYLIDDPLSAVDAKVGRDIFNRCICGFLRNKLRVVVTHQEQFFKHADQILVMRHGEIEARGTYEELLNTGVDFSSVVVETSDIVTNTNGLKEVENKHIQHIQMGKTMEEDSVVVHAWEASRSHQISPSLILEYFQHGGNWLTLTSVLVVFLMAQLFSSLSDWWIAKWSSLSEHESMEEMLSISQSLFLHLFLTSVLIGLGLARTVIFQKVCHNAAVSFHSKIVTAFMRSPISFFDQSSIGWLLGHYIYAVEDIDFNVPGTCPGLLKVFIQVVGSITVVVWYTPVVLLPVLLMTPALAYIHQRFSCAHHQLYQLDTARRVHYINYISGTVFGLDTLRAHQVQAKCIKDFDLHVELFNSGWISLNAVHDWMYVNVNLIAATFLITSVFGCMMAGKDLGAAEVGLIMTTIVPLLGSLGELMVYFATSQSVYYESRRVFEITKLPSEFSPVNNLKPSQKWLRGGAISFQNVTFSYTTKSPTVLKDISFSIKPAEKVGIVGRTGAGKSSLVQVLCHLGEYQGQIFIDGTDISTIGLCDLRTSIAVIPQDPALFSCSVRQNLDPEGKHSDNVLWETLEQVAMANAVNKLKDGLDSQLREGGGNFSVGERQLFCLARAILHNSVILILDEATARVDPRTEEVIWEVVREKFRTSTVLTIAHRLSSVMTADRIMVMGNGEVKEFDEPAKLLNNQQSHLFRLVEQTGKSQQHHLMSMAGVYKHIPEQLYQP